MHGLNNNTNQVQKMPMFMKALKIYYTVCSQKTCTSVFNYKSLRQTRTERENLVLRTL